MYRLILHTFTSYSSLSHLWSLLKWAKTQPKNEREDDDEKNCTNLNDTIWNGLGGKCHIYAYKNSLYIQLVRWTWKWKKNIPVLTEFSIWIICIIVQLLWFSPLHSMIAFVCWIVDFLSHFLPLRSLYRIKMATPFHCIHTLIMAYVFSQLIIIDVWNLQFYPSLALFLSQWAKTKKKKK